jgi:hypothetical protein
LKFLLSFLIILAISFTSQAHEYFFGFAEMEYNATEGVYEGTLIFSAHDFEMWLNQKGIKVVDLEDHIESYSFMEDAGEVVFEDFSVSNNTSFLHLSIIGFEVLNNGLCQIYFASSKSPAFDSLDVKFELLMDVFPDQQNKITFLDGKNSYTATFTQVNKQANIQIQ